MPTTSIQQEPAVAPAKKFTQHVRINVTAKDVAAFNANAKREAFAVERRNPVAMAINRTLRQGYAATFDGMSVGILKTNHASAVNEAGYYEEYPDGGSLMKSFARLGEPQMNKTGPETKFFRGVDQRVQQFHKLCLAHRRKTGIRVTVSLPSMTLRRTISRNCTNQATHSYDDCPLNPHNK